MLNLTLRMVPFTHNRILNYQQNPNKIMKNQGQNENRNNTFHSQEFIHFIAELIGPSPR